MNALLAENTALRAQVKRMRTVVNVADILAKAVLEYQAVMEIEVEKP